MGYALAAIGAALFSTKAIFIKLAFAEHTDAALMLAYRMIFATPIYIAIGLWAYAKRRLKGEPPISALGIWHASFTGVLGYYAASEFDFAGLAYIPASLERLVLFTYPLFVMFLNQALLKEPITRFGLAAAALTYVGLAIVFLTDLPDGGTNTVTGTLLVLGAAFSFAWHQILAKRYIAPMGSTLFTSIALTAAGVLCILHQAILGHGSFAAPTNFLWLSFGCAMIATVLPTFLINAGLQRTSPEAVSMIATVSPIVTIGLAIVILGEHFTSADAVGSLLVLIGVGLFTVGDSRRAKANPS